MARNFCLCSTGYIASNPQACRGIWTNLLEIRDEMNSGLTREGHHLVSGGCDNVCRELEARQRAREDMLVQQTTPMMG